MRLVVVVLLAVACTGCSLIFPLELGDREPGCSSLTLLTDDFSTGSLSPNWRISNVGTETIMDDQALLAQNRSQTGALTSVAFWDLRETAFSADVQIDFLGPTSYVEMSLAETIEPGSGKPSDSVRFYVQSGMLLADRSVNGETLSVGVVQYDPIAHAKWRIGQTRNVTHWDVAGADGEFHTIQQFEDLPISYVQPRLLLGCDPSTDGCQARFDNVDGGGAPTGETCRADTQRDRFNGEVIDFERWHPLALDCAWNQFDGQIVATYKPEGNSDQRNRCLLQSSALLDFTNSSISVEVTQPPAPPGEAIFNLRRIDGTSIQFQLDTANLIATKNGGPPLGQLLQTVSFDPIKHRFLRFRGTNLGGAPSIVMETSQNGDNYEFLAQTSDLGDLTEIIAELGIDGMQTGSVAFDNVQP